MKIICIVGPTGVGKTKLSLELAKKLNGEIINADSTQVYKKLDIATAKIKDMEGTTHHLIDIKEITDDYTVFDFKRDAEIIINDLTKKSITPILVGGTGLYIKALLYNYSLTKETKEYKDYSNLSNDELFDKLLKVDPNTAIHKNNTSRVIRALNYFDINQTPMSDKVKDDKLEYDTIFIGLTTDRETLYENINKRVDQMMSEGLIDEAKDIYDSNVRTKAVLTPIGYKELFPYFDGSKTLEECILKIKQHTRKYAKRQYTWFKNQMDITWFNVDFDNFDNTIMEVLEHIKKA